MSTTPLQAYTIIGEFKPEEILPLTGMNHPPRRVVVDGKHFLVKMASLRYEVFKRDLKCASCEHVGTIMRLEYDRGADPGKPHFNLYAETPEGLVLMTKDHVVPRSAGGETTLDNLVTMCATCNHAKDAHLPPGRRAGGEP